MHALFQSDDQEPQSVVPATNVFPRIEGAEIAAATIGERAGGDFYDSIRVSPERVLFGLLDVAGRRETNQAILTAAQEMFREAGLELFASSDVNESDAMTALCLHLNRRLIEVSAGVHSCPAFIGCYHERFGTLCYTNAGHTPGLLRDRTGVIELPSTGLPLGLFSHATCDSPIVGVEKGSALLLVSRGVIESSAGDDGNSDTEFSVERVKHLLGSLPLKRAEEICASILNAASESARTSLEHEDRTALALLRAG